MLSYDEGFSEMYYTCYSAVLRSSMKCYFPADTLRNISHRGPERHHGFSLQTDVTVKGTTLEGTNRSYS